MHERTGLVFFFSTPRMHAHLIWLRGPPLQSYSLISLILLSSFTTNTGLLVFSKLVIWFNFSPLWNQRLQRSHRIVAKKAGYLKSYYRDCYILTFKLCVHFLEHSFNCTWISTDSMCQILYWTKIICYLCYFYLLKSLTQGLGRRLGWQTQDWVWSPEPTE